MKLLGLLLLGRGRDMRPEEIPQECWDRFDELLERLAEKAEEIYGSKSFTSIGRLCGVTHETVRRYGRKIIFPTDLKNMARLVAPLGMSGLEGMMFVLGYSENESKEITRMDVKQFLRAMPPEERIKLFSEAST